MSLVWSARISYWKERLLLVLVNNQNNKIFSNIYFSPAALWRISTFFFFFWNDGNFSVSIVAMIFLFICCHQRHFLAETKSQKLSSQSYQLFVCTFYHHFWRIASTWRRCPGHLGVLDLVPDSRKMRVVENILTEHDENWLETAQRMVTVYCTFLDISHRFVHADVDDGIPQYWALGELYWKHCHVERNILNKDC